MEELPIGTVIATLGFVLGGVFGAVAQRTNFCTMGALSDIVYMEDWNRFRAWMLAVAIAILGSQGLHMAGIIDLSTSIYQSANLGWAGAIIGGLLFGFGMTMGGGCGNKTLVRIGAGSLKSVIVALILGIFAYMTLRGLIGLARVELEAVTVIDLAEMGLETQGIPGILAAFGLSPDVARAVVTLVIAGGILAFCFKDAEFRSSGRDVAAGVLIGLLIPVAWYVTGVVGFDDFEPTPLASFTFVNPVGESIQYLMTFSGATINFGIAVVGGIITGSFVSAKLAGQFRIESFNSADDMISHMFGAALMGIGGVLALGCTIGQGITGMSTLAVGSVIALASIILGGLIGLKRLEEGSLKEGIAALFSRG
ncbi:MAG: YeeE/YedE family protein [Rhodospirillales bacterium]|nr:YeeE/YedE family protein [Rhodospirillales bacterium]